MTVHFRYSVADDSGYPRSGKSGTSLGRRAGGRGFYRNGGKRVLDYLFILLSWPVVLPLVGIMALLVALDGASPFYRQRRVGRNGRVFHIIKLRTMVPDAEHILQDYLERNPSARREWDHKQKLCRDPRITRLGSFLRRTSLDELPQLWNVLRGEMSLIGPRPMMVEQQGIYPDPGAAYYRLRPGITGLWQVSDRNESGFCDRAAYDLEYYNSLSLKTDLSIFLRTIRTVLQGTGY